MEFSRMHDVYVIANRQFGTTSQKFFQDDDTWTSWHIVLVILEEKKRGTWMYWLKICTS